MSVNSYVRARIEPQLKTNVSHVLSDPNEKTVAAMEAADRREIEYCESLDELLK